MTLAMPTFLPLLVLVWPAMIKCLVETWQWAAVKIVCESRMVPPQKWRHENVLHDRMETCQGMGDGAALPPTILSEFMNLGSAGQVLLGLCFSLTADLTSCKKMELNTNLVKSRRLTWFSSSKTMWMGSWSILLDAKTSPRGNGLTVAADVNVCEIKNATAQSLIWW